MSILLPHYDDELFILPFIEDQLRKGFLIKIFFMTYDYNPVREGESAKTFSHYSGVETFQLGRLNNFIDGKLNNRTNEVLILLEENPIIKFSESIVCPTFEGGHVDHDEIFKISYALALKLKKPLFVFSLYNAYQTPFVRVATLFNGPVLGNREVVTFTFKSGASFFKRCFYYRSQVIILLVLLPGLLRLFFIKRKIEILKVENFDPRIPHPGKLFYDNPWKKRIKRLLRLN